MRRDALGDVMDALDHFACATCDGRGTAPEGFQWPEPMCRECMGARWRSDLSPAEAVEALATARLWPWEIGDERAPRWWCEECEGTGRAQEPGPPRGRVCLCCGVPADELAAAPRGIGHVADPPSLAALVAVASLGRPLLQRITHTLVPWIARAAGCPDARVVWRVMSRDGLREHRDRQRVRGSDEWIVDAFSTEMGHAADRNGESAWPRECPWPALRPTHRVHRAWPALRALAVGDEATPQPTGVHLVALDASRIVLAVEAIGGDRG